VEPLVGIVVALFLGLLLTSIERNPRVRRSMNQQVALAVAFFLVLLVLEAVGVEQTVAFVMTFGLFAYALVVLFTVQRLRRPT